uniref:Uncharacterized protein C10orf95-like n=1 Tax=Castor canadensis TaxID=51338 RepID=A0A8B7UJ94_CASCN|nr:uncharacterized protein C10orf95-like [Castor canadensis]
MRSGETRTGGGQSGPSVPGGADGWSPDSNRRMRTRWRRSRLRPRCLASPGVPPLSAVPAWGSLNPWALGRPTASSPGPARARRGCLRGAGEAPRRVPQRRGEEGVCAPASPAPFGPFTPTRPPHGNQTAQRPRAERPQHNSSLPPEGPPLAHFPPPATAYGTRSRPLRNPAGIEFQAAAGEAAARVMRRPGTSWRPGSPRPPQIPGLWVVQAPLAARPDFPAFSHREIDTRGF